MGGAMAGGKNNTQRIEALESQAANMSARLDVHDREIKGISEVLKKSADATEGHASKITVIEQQILLLDLKGALTAITTIEKDLLILRKDLDNLGKWKDDQKKAGDEAARRFWAFGPNVAAAIISGIITLLGIGFSVGLTYWLNKTK